MGVSVSGRSIDPAATLSNFFDYYSLFKTLNRDQIIDYVAINSMAKPNLRDSSPQGKQKFKEWTSAQKQKDYYQLRIAKERAQLKIEADHNRDRIITAAEASLFVSNKKSEMLENIKERDFFVEGMSESIDRLIARLRARPRGEELIRI